MKKLTKILGVLTIIFSLFMSLGFRAPETVGATGNDDQVEVTLHKKKMTALPNPLIQNTGEEMPIFAGYDNMPNVTFEVRDVTTQFYDLRAAGDSFDIALGKVAETPEGSTISTGTTDVNGQVTFDLDAKSGGKDAIYVFVETDAPAGTTKAANLVLALPMYDAQNKLMKKIHLYPKNVVDAEGKVIVEKKGTANGEALAGAEFIVSRELTPGAVEYLAPTMNETSGLHNWTPIKADARVFTTGEDGKLTIDNLEHGSYQLIEIASPANASIIDDGITPFTINKHKEVVTLEVYNDTIDVDKERADKDDYNVGDLIPYSITVNVPEGIAYVGDDGSRHVSMVITDLPDAGLQYNNDLSAAGLTIDPSWIDTTGTNGFVLTIPAAELADLSGDDLILTYNMYLDGTANPDVGYKNLVKVHTRELKDEDGTKEVFTGGFKFKKVDANFNELNTLAGAEFVVRNADADTADYLHIHPTTKAVTWVDNKAGATVFTTGSDGLINVAGLEYGTYFLEETKAPADYVLLENRVPFTVEKGSFTESLRLDIKNIREGRLPSTGGSGIVGILGLGAVLITTTGGYYIKRRRDA